VASDKPVQETTASAPTSVGTAPVRRTPKLVVLGTLIAAVTVLGVAKAILVPIALALYVSFVLTPPQRALQRLGCGRVLSVILTMALALTAVGGFAAALDYQVEGLASQFTDYAVSMHEKLAALRGSQSGSLSLLKTTADRMGSALDDQAKNSKAATPVRVIPTEQTALGRVEEAVEPLVGPLALVTIVLVLVTFMLGQRDDLRDRVIRIVGSGKVTSTTLAMDEAVERISRFLLALSLINVGFGAVVTVGLYVIGVPHALLWGSLAAVLRFVPYAGAMLSMVLPMLLAFARFPGWTQTLETMGLFVGLDAITGYVIEPLLVGNRTGVSSLALLISSFFWTWLWGPIGLVLATPLTVCVVVLGRNVPQLQFLSIALRDEPALDPAARLYQRLLARDGKEAAAMARQFARANGYLSLVDEVLVGALGVAMQDGDEADISPKDFDYVVSAIRSLAGKLSASERAEGPKQSSSSGPLILGVPVHGAADDAVLDLLGGIVKTGRWEALARLGNRAERVTAMVAKKPAVVCITNIPPAGAALTRFFCRRLRKDLPSVKILVLRPTARADDTARAAARLREAGADGVVASIEEAEAYLAQI
jgi:predicted PurR-regulated permease PerM